MDPKCGVRKKRIGLSTRWMCSKFVLIESLSHLLRMWKNISLLYLYIQFELIILFLPQCFKVSSVPSHVPKEERREAVELQPPKLPPKKLKLYQPGDLGVTIKPRKSPLHLTLLCHTQLRRTLTRLPASLRNQTEPLRHQPRGRANR